MYAVITITYTNGNISLECYGPYKTKALAKDALKKIKYPCVKSIEFMFGHKTE